MCGLILVYMGTSEKLKHLGKTLNEVFNAMEIIECLEVCESNEEFCFCAAVTIILISKNKSIRFTKDKRRQDFFAKIAFMF